MRIILLFVACFLCVTTSAQRTVGLFQNDSLSLNGYTLISNLNGTETHLIDNCGDIVNSWTQSTFKPGPVVHLLEDGSLLKTCKLTTGNFIAGGSGGRLERYNWNDSLIWEYDFDSPTERQHHDVYPMPNGNLLVLAWDLITRTDAINSGIDTLLHNQEIWSEKLVEITPVGSDSAVIVWEWKLWDHIVQDINTNLSTFGDIAASKGLVDINYFNNNGISRDFFHANGIDYNPNLDQIVISVRNFDEIWVIDHSTTTAEAATSIGGLAGQGGDLLYRWGNPEAYRSGDISTKKLFGQHNPNWIKNGFRDQGKIIVFNNGYNAPVQVSKVEIINPPILANRTYSSTPNTAYLPDTAEWFYNLPVFVDFVSGVERLENGNTFITSGPDGHLYELDSNDMVVWEYISPLEANNVRTTQGAPQGSNTTFRAYRYAEDYPAFTNRMLTPTVPIELNPLPSQCVIFSKTSTSILESDNEVAKNNFVMYPNPSNGEFVLKTEGFTNNSVNVIIREINGRLISNEFINNADNPFIKSFNLQNEAKGIYFVSIVDGKSIFNGKLIIQ